jgi:hypothetical protein
VFVPLQFAKRNSVSHKIEARTHAHAWRITSLAFLATGAGGACSALAWTFAAGSLMLYCIRVGAICRGGGGGGGFVDLNRVSSEAVVVSRARFSMGRSPPLPSAFVPDPVSGSNGLGATLSSPSSRLPSC